MDMSKHTKDTPAQKRERLQWIVDVVREHQGLVGDMLYALERGSISTAKGKINQLHKQDRDALLQEGGILTDEQIRKLK